ncbi:MAG: hypothetical protein H6Q81_1627 [Deltaproteobacteria bacterium]|nr:hypothetical protein [Deltaproteobacteria bacterium]
MSLRPARAAACAAGLGAVALPGVVLFLLPVGVPRPFKSPATTPQRKNMASPGGFEPPSPP